MKVSHLSGDNLLLEEPEEEDLEDSSDCADSWWNRVGISTCIVASHGFGRAQVSESLIFWRWSWVAWCSSFRRRQFYGRLWLPQWSLILRRRCSWFGWRTSELLVWTWTSFQNVRRDGCSIEQLEPQQNPDVTADVPQFDANAEDGCEDVTAEIRLDCFTPYVSACISLVLFCWSSGLPPLAFLLRSQLMQTSFWFSMWFSWSNNFMLRAWWQFILTISKKLEHQLKSMIFGFVSNPKKVNFSTEALGGSQHSA